MENKIRYGNAFNILSAEQKHDFFAYLKEVEINVGCGQRPCRMCCYRAPKSQKSMPFGLIQAIHAHKQNAGLGNIYIRHFRVGDPVYYQDGEKTYADVAIDALEKGIRFEDVTHGYLIDEEVPAQAVEKLVAWSSKNNRTGFMSFSYDPLGFLETDQETHQKSVMHSLVALAPILRKIYAQYIPHHMSKAGEFSLEHVQALISTLVPKELQHLVQYEEIILTGRMTDIYPEVTLERKPIPTQSGFSIACDGTVFFAPNNNAKRRRLGNISTQILTPLPLPISIPDV